MSIENCPLERELPEVKMTPVDFEIKDIRKGKEAKSQPSTIKK